MDTVVAVEFERGIEDAWSDVAQFVPKLLGALIVFFVGWIVARAIRKISIGVLKRIRFDDLVDRSGLGASVERAGYPDAGVLLAKIIYYAVLLLVLQLAISVFGPSPVQDALNGIVAYLPNVIVAVIIVLITGAIAARVKDLVQASTAAAGYSDTLARAAAVAVWVVGGFAALDQLQIAEGLVSALYQGAVATLSLILVIKFGVGGIWAARDRFWPGVYDRLQSQPSSPPGTPR
jgi:mechanosensitive ion channel-like protein